MAAPRKLSELEWRYADELPDLPTGQVFLCRKADPVTPSPVRAAMLITANMFWIAAKPGIKVLATEDWRRTYQFLTTRSEGEIAFNMWADALCAQPYEESPLDSLP